VYNYLDTVSPLKTNKHASTHAIFSKISLGIPPPPGVDLFSAEFMTKSRISDAKLQMFLQTDITNGRQGCLRANFMYGVGPATIENFRRAGIVTVHQLLGRLLYDNSGAAFDSENATAWLKSMGCSASHCRAVVVQLFSRLQVRQSVSKSCLKRRPPFFPPFFPFFLLYRNCTFHTHTPPRR